MKEITSRIFTRKQIMAIDDYLGLVDVRQHLCGRRIKAVITKEILPNGNTKVSVVVDE